MGRPAYDMTLIRAERTGDVHVVRGAVIASRGRDLSDTLCDRIIAGRALIGDTNDLTCTECRAEYVPPENWSTVPGRLTVEREENA